MATNTNLTREIAEKLIKREIVLCPSCGKKPLVSRYEWKKQSVEFKCSECGEIYRPCKAI